jgi:hypothetical protein
MIYQERHASRRANFAAARETLLAAIRERLEGDERFVAAWLGGSYGRGEVDALSDLDLFCVTTDSAASLLCARSWSSAGRASGERLAIVSLFGEPAALHEAHQNAPPAGTFTFVMYRHSGLVVDWTLIPQALARRPPAALLLFARAEIPLEPTPAPASGTEQAEALRERLGYFWLMAVVTARYVARRDIVAVLKLLDILYQTSAEIDALVEGRAAPYRRGSRASLVLDADGQVLAIRTLAQRAQAVASALSAARGEPADQPMEELNIWLEMAQATELLPDAADRSG